MDRVIIRGLRLPCRIGVLAEERALPQSLELHLTIELRDVLAAGSGQLADTVSYSEVCRKIRELAEGREWSLLEQLAEDIVQLIFSNFAASREVNLEVRKFIVPGTDYVGIEVSRSR